jgi:K+-sensing histidine kinase KdpD
MLKALHRKILIINILFISFTLIVGFTVFFSISFSRAKRDLKEALKDVILTEEPMFSYSQLFGVVHTNDKIHILVYDKLSSGLTIMTNKASSEEGHLIGAAKTVINSTNESGILKKFELYYCKVETDTKIRMAFIGEKMFRDMYINSAKESFFTNIAIVVISLSFIMITNLIFSKRNLQFIDKMNEEQRRFVADASHELKTPLAIILANIGMLRSHEDEPVRLQKKWLDSTETEVAHLKKMIDGMLLLARAESTIAVRSSDKVDLSTMVTKCLLQAEILTIEADIKLDSDIEPGVVIVGQELMLFSIVMGLIENAIKYERKGGKIKITLKRYGNKVIYKVRNSTLISDADLPHIFDRFYRADSSQDTGRVGHGLGLAIVKAAAENMGGQIKAVSSEKSGTVFTVIFYDA